MNIIFYRCVIVWWNYEKLNAIRMISSSVMKKIIFIKKRIDLFGHLLFLGELGDYDPELHEGNYISEQKLLLKQTDAIEEKALELHQTQLKGFTPEQAETHFLRLASQLDTYAVDPHPVKVSHS
jgi:hypothetical protein